MQSNTSSQPAKAAKWYGLVRSPESGGRRSRTLRNDGETAQVQAKVAAMAQADGTDLGRVLQLRFWTQEGGWNHTLTARGWPASWPSATATRRRSPGIWAARARSTATTSTSDKRRNERRRSRRRGGPPHRDVESGHVSDAPRRRLREAQHHRDIGSKRSRAADGLINA